MSMNTTVILNGQPVADLVDSSCGLQLVGALSKKLAEAMDVKREEGGGDTVDYLGLVRFGCTRAQKCQRLSFVTGLCLLSLLHFST